MPLNKKRLIEVELLVGIIGTSVSIVAIALAIFYGIKATKEKKAVWAYSTYRYIGKGTGAPPELKVSFGNIEVEQVCITRIIFFNKGREVIRKNDITEKIAISLPEVIILRAPIVYCISKAQNKFALEQKGQSVFLDFEYLGHYDGAAIEILHNGNSDIKPKISGNIIDSEIKNISPFPPISRRKVLSNMIQPGVSLVVFAGWFAYMLFEPNGVLIKYLSSNKTLSDSFSLIFLSIMFLGFFGVFIYGLIRQLQNYYRFPKWLKHG